MTLPLTMKNPVIILVTTYFLHLHIASQVHVYGHKTTTPEVYIMVSIFLRPPCISINTIQIQK